MRGVWAPRAWDNISKLASFDTIHWQIVLAVWNTKPGDEAKQIVTISLFFRDLLDKDENTEIRAEIFLNPEVKTSGKLDIEKLVENGEEIREKAVSEKIRETTPPLI